MFFAPFNAKAVLRVDAESGAADLLAEVEIGSGEDSDRSPATGKFKGATSAPCGAGWCVFFAPHQGKSVLRVDAESGAASWLARTTLYPA